MSLQYRTVDLPSKMDPDEVCSSLATTASSKSPELKKVQVGSPPTHSPSEVPQARGLDLDAWRNDLRCLHQTLDQAVQGFILAQTRQLSGIAEELALRKDRVAKKEQQFEELSSSIAAFMEAEAQKLALAGVDFGNQEADSKHAAYDAELPGPQVLHRINRLWRHAMHAFDISRTTSETDKVEALRKQHEEHEEALARQSLEIEEALAGQREVAAAAELQHQDEVAQLQRALAELTGRGEQQDEASSQLEKRLGHMSEELGTARQEVSELAEQLQAIETSKQRAEYEHCAEKEDLKRYYSSTEEKVETLQASLTEAEDRESELHQRCTDQAAKLEQMKQMMDDQEFEVSNKLERVQQYLKERTAGAQNAEKQQKDAERMAERWQVEVRRLQSEKDRLMKVVLDYETQKAKQETVLQSTREQLMSEVSALQDALRQKAETGQSSNREVLQRHEEELKAKLQIERQREKERSIALLKKKEQELQIKDQQLRAARQQIEELAQPTGNVPATLGASEACSPTRRRSTSQCGDPGALPQLSAR
mmetsp:Transcript_40266/g.92580  ORF Transcript_40266/g.92580 Transcript_40266/m.92580 type:complete len:538 (-) Transcript_40266:13-1626(-)